MTNLTFNIFLNEIYFTLQKNRLIAAYFLFFNYFRIIKIIKKNFTIVYSERMLLVTRKKFKNEYKKLRFFVKIVIFQQNNSIDYLML